MKKVSLLVSLLILLGAGCVGLDGVQQSFLEEKIQCKELADHHIEERNETGLSAWVEDIIYHPELDTCILGYAEHDDVVQRRGYYIYDIIDDHFFFADSYYFFEGALEDEYKSYEDIERAYDKALINTINHPVRVKSVNR